VVYDKLGRHTDAEAELAKLKAAAGDAAAYQYATIYAQWGNTPKALESLETAFRLQDPGLVALKTDPLMDRSASVMRVEERGDAGSRDAGCRLGYRKESSGARPGVQDGEA
jgi:hypothetical protein